MEIGKIFCANSDLLFWFVAKKVGKSKEEAQLEKRQELERRLEDVKGQLGTSQSKKTPKKGS